MARGAWWATVHGAHKESDMTEQLNDNNLEISVCSLVALFKKKIFWLFLVPLPFYINFCHYL